MGSFQTRSTLNYPITNGSGVRDWLDTRDPTTSDFRNFNVFDVWINEAGLRAWIMVKKTATSGTWIQMASSGTGIVTLTGNSGGAVSADGSNNINVIGSGPVTITGAPLTHTLTASLNGTVATTYVEDVGSATPSANTLSIRGAAGITTSGAGSTVTITAGGTIPTTFTEDSGSATPSANNLNVLGGTGIATSGAGSTVTIATAGTVATTYTCNAGSATPSAHNLNVFGAGSTTTSGAGSTITITSTGGGLMWTEVTVVGPTQMAINNGYVANNAVSTVQLTLPLTAAFGSVLYIAGKGAGLWQINQNAGQVIHGESSNTTVGATGTLVSTQQRDSVYLLCTTADTEWTAIDIQGNLIFN